jgi:hypothetical protein
VVTEVVMQTVKNEVVFPYAENEFLKADEIAIINFKIKEDFKC